MNCIKSSVNEGVIPIIDSVKRRSYFPKIILHWLILLSIIICLATELRIATDRVDATWAQSVSLILPQGNVIVWHLWSAVTLLALSAAYISFLWNAGLLSRIALDRLWLNNLFRPVTARDRWKAVNVTVYWMAFMAVLIAGCTGISMNLFPNTADIPLIAMVHRTAAWSIPLYVVLHVLALTAMGGVSYLLKIIRPRPAFGIAALVAVCTGGATTLAYWGVEEAMQNGLPVTRVQQGPALDGKADDKIWGDVKQADIRTSRGANGDDGGTIVTIMAVHDGTHIYTLF
ncbi:MAG: cytochrome b/b6 domain-containing protein, partial [Alphaproteobacteria bacterium]